MEDLVNHQTWENFSHYFIVIVIETGNSGQRGRDSIRGQWKTSYLGVPVVAQRSWTQRASIRTDAGSISGLAWGLRIWRCRELWCKSQIWLSYNVAAAVAVGRQLGTWPLAWELPCAESVALKRKRKSLILAEKHLPFIFGISWPLCNTSHSIQQTLDWCFQTS